MLWQAGEGLDLTPGCPNLIERIEGGLLSYGNEMTRENNPLEYGLEKYCQLDGSLDFIGKDALMEIAKQGHQREIRGLIFDGDPCPACQYPWPLSIDNRRIGYVTSAIWSPRFESNVALAMLDRDYWNASTRAEMITGDGSLRQGVVCELPLEGP